MGFTNSCRGRALSLERREHSGDEFTHSLIHYLKNQGTLESWSQVAPVWHLPCHHDKCFPCTLRPRISSGQVLWSASSYTGDRDLAGFTGSSRAAVQPAAGRVRLEGRSEHQLQSYGLCVK